MPAALDHLIRTLARLPGIGRRTAERMAYRLLLRQQDLLQELRAALEAASTQVRLCSHCGNFTEAGQDPCAICQDPARDPALLCLVESAPDIALLEQTRSFKGRYYCLAGKISPQTQETVTAQRLKHLAKRLEEDGVREVLLALNTDVESDATAAMLAEFLRPFSVRVSRLAFGIPAGSGLAYSDPETLARAIRGRQPLDGEAPGK